MRKVAFFLGGGQGSGKSEASAFLEKVINDSGHFTTIQKFADEVYRIHDIVEREMSTIAGREPVKKNGPLLQIIGTEIGRNLYGEDIWVRATYRKTQEFLKRTLHAYEAFNYEECAAAVIYEDVRFENELDMRELLLKDGFEVVSVYFEASLDIRKARVESFRSNTGHASESSLENFLNKFDLKINTEGPVEAKDARLYELLKEKQLVSTPEELLENVLAQFNATLEDWENKTKFGANFEWYYTSEGKKRLRKRDAAPVETLPPDKAAVRIAEVQETMEKLDGPG